MEWDQGAKWVTQVPAQCMWSVAMTTHMISVNGNSILPGSQSKNGAKEIINKTKWQPTEWEKILQKSYQIKLVSKIYKELRN